MLTLSSMTITLSSATATKIHSDIKPRIQDQFNSMEVSNHVEFKTIMFSQMLFKIQTSIEILMVVLY